MARYFNPQLDRRLYTCSETGEQGIRPEFVERLDDLREKCAFAFVINSGYRSPRHSKEAAKDKPGQHTLGHAADIAVSGGVQRRTVVREALRMGFMGIGVAKTFVHVDDRITTPVMWVY